MLCKSLIFNLQKFIWFNNFKTVYKKYSKIKKEYWSFPCVPVVVITSRVNFYLRD